MLTNKEKYIRFCEQNDFVPIFSQPWWMDAVCVDGYWDVLLYEKDDKVLGALPYYVKKKFGLSYITQPQFTQNNGIVIKYPDNQKYEKKLSYEKEVMTALIEQVEKLPIVFYQQNFNCKYTNWLPFYWKGYKQTTFYTYRLENIRNCPSESIYLCFNDVKQKEIKRAKKLKLMLYYDLSIEEFYEDHKKTLRDRGREIGYDFALFKRIVDSVYSHSAGRILYVRDEQENLLCVRLVIWDKKSAYSLISSTNQKYKNTGASTFLFNECIKYVSDKVNVFDFEGSMDENIENSYRKFGTVQTPYFSINKIMTKNPFLQILINWKLR